MKEIKCPACSSTNSVEIDESLRTVSCRHCGEKIVLASLESGAKAENEAPDDVPTEETVLIPEPGKKAKQEGQAEEKAPAAAVAAASPQDKAGHSESPEPRPSRPFCPSDDKPAASEALEPIGKPAGAVQTALSSRLSLSAIGVCEGDLPYFDPDTGRLHVDGREITEGTRLFIYNEQGEPLFGYTFQDGTLVVSPEGPARAVQPPTEVPAKAVEKGAVEAPAKEKPAPKQEESEEEEVEEMEEEVLEAEGITTSARRARAAAKAAEQRARRKTQARRPRIGPAAAQAPKSPAAMAVTFLFSLSTLACLGFLTWWVVSGRNMTAGKGSDAPKTMTFQPVDFSSADMDISEPLETCQGRLVKAGWKIGAQASNTGWALRQSGCIDSGVMKGGQIQRERKGKRGFRVAMQVGFLKLPEDKAQKLTDNKVQAAANVSLLLEAPEIRKKVHFGFGKDIEATFVTIVSGTKKEYEQRHPLSDKLVLKSNTWYKLEIEADGDYLNFIFNGMKVDGIEMKAKDIKEIAIRAAQTRALIRHFSLEEEGVAEP